MPRVAGALLQLMPLASTFAVLRLTAMTGSEAPKIRSRAVTAALQDEITELRAKLLELEQLQEIERLQEEITRVKGQAEVSTSLQGPASAAIGAVQQPASSAVGSVQEPASTAVGAVQEPASAAVESMQESASAAIQAAENAQELATATIAADKIAPILLILALSVLPLL